MMSRNHLTLNEKMQLIGGYNRDLGLQDVSLGDHRMTAIVFIDVDSETPTVKEWFGIHETIVTCDVNEEREDDDVIQCRAKNVPPKLTEALEMMQNFVYFLLQSNHNRVI